MSEKRYEIIPDINDMVGQATSRSGACSPDNSEYFRMKHWDKEELDFLINNWSSMTAKQITGYINRTEKAIWKQAMRQGLSVRRVDLTELREYIKTHGGETSSRLIAEKFNKSEVAVRQVAFRMGVSLRVEDDGSRRNAVPQKVWDTVREHAGKKSTAEIAVMIHKSRASVCRLASAMGISLRVKHEMDI